MSTRMRITTFKRLAEAEKLGTILVRLMMVINDLGLADDSLEQWHKAEEQHRKDRAAGAKMYFVRVQIAHIYEALHIINCIKKTPDLMHSVERCDEKTRNSFNAVAAFIGTDEHQKMRIIRNKITFHYDQNIVVAALDRLSKKHPTTQLTITIGSRTIDWYCEPSDRIIDNAVFGDIFGISDDSDLKAEIDRIVVRLQEIGSQLVEFAGYFIFHHIGRS